MRRTTRVGVILAVVGMLGPARPAPGQPVAPGMPAVSPEVNALAQAMADQVRQLGDAVEADLGPRPGGRELAQDTRELSQAVGEFQKVLAAARDPFPVRQAYAGIDAGWNHLRVRLSPPGVATPAVSRAAQRVAETDARIHQVLGINAYPPDYYGTGPAPSGLAEAKRLALALVDRAQALAAVIRADLVGGMGARLLQEAINLAQAADAFHDGIDLNASPALARAGFAAVSAQSDDLDRDLAAAPTTPRVLAAWQAYESAYVLMRRNLGLPVEPEDLPGTAIATGGPSPIVALSERLIDEVVTFLRDFRATGGAVPEAGLIEADLIRLRDAAEDFRRDVGPGADVGRLAYEFRDVDVAWQRLARRASRVARGRVGPGLAMIGKMGQTCAQIHQLLGLPGYPPAIVPPPG
jgi:hypothetical protein